MQSARLLLGACLFLLIVQSSLVEARIKRKSKSREDTPPDPIQEPGAGDPSLVREERQPSTEGATLREKNIDEKELTKGSGEIERKKKSYCSDTNPLELSKEENDDSVHGAIQRSAYPAEDGYGKYPVGPAPAPQYGGYQMAHHPAYDRKEEYGGQQGYGGEKAQPPANYYKPQPEEPEYHHGAPGPMYHQGPYQQQPAPEYHSAAAPPSGYASPSPSMPAYGGHQVEHGLVSSSYLAHSGSYGSGHGPYAPAMTYSSHHYSPQVSYASPPAYGAQASYKQAVSYPSHPSHAPAYGSHAVISYAPAISHAISYVPAGYHAPAPYSYHPAAPSYPAYPSPSYAVSYPSYHAPPVYHAPAPSYGSLFVPAPNSYHGAPASYAGASYHGMAPSYHDLTPSYHAGYPSYDSHPSMPAYGGGYHSSPYNVPSYGQPLPYGVPHTPVYLTCSLNPNPPKSESSPSYDSAPSYDSRPSYPPPSYAPPSYGAPSYAQPPYYRAAAEDAAEEANNRQPSMDGQRGNNKTGEVNRGEESQTPQPQQQQSQEPKRKDEIKVRQVEDLNENRNEDSQDKLSRIQRMPFGFLRQRQLESQINAKPIFFARE